MLTSIFKRSRTLFNFSSLQTRYFSTKKTYESHGGYCQEKSTTRAFDRFQDQVCVVTGASGNFGRTCASRLVREGAKVALLDIIDPSSVQKELHDTYPDSKVWSYKLDVSDENQVQDTVKTIIKDFGRIDCLFNNAGIQGDFTQLHEYSMDNFRKIMDVNVVGVFAVLQAVANAMKNQVPQGGSIVNTASMAAHSGPPNMIAYGTSKSAVLHMTRIAAKDLAPYNIRVNSISPAFIGPGFMWTRQIELQAAANSQYYDKNPDIVAEQMIGSTPLRRYGSIDEVIGPVTFLLSDDASYLTGIDIQVTGGMN